MKKILTMCGLILISISFCAWGENNPEVQSAKKQEVQETSYVTDKLRLSLYKNADARSGTIKLLTSGDVLYVLEKTGPYSKVRTNDGKTGWVKNGFLVSTPTASFLLIEEQKKNGILAEQIEKFSDTKKLVEDYEHTISQMSSDFESQQQNLNQAEQELETVNNLNSELSIQIEVNQQGNLTWTDVLIHLKNYWYVGLAIVVILFLLGFFIGKRMIEARVKRRFQGMKVW